MDGIIVSMAVQVAYGVDEQEKRDALTIGSMLEEAEDSYLLLFRGLQERDLRTPRLVIYDAHSGLVAAIRKFFSVQTELHTKHSGVYAPQGEKCV